jgi:heme/copper-type cytochrome/quinol oxidase subunit 4
MAVAFIFAAALLLFLIGLAYFLMMTQEEKR